MIHFKLLTLQFKETSCGVMRVDEELKENGNGEASFSLKVGNAFLVTEHISADALCYPYEASEGRSEGRSEERSEGRIPLSIMEAKVFEAIRRDPTARYADLAMRLEIGETTLYKAIRRLKAMGFIVRRDGNTHGRWEIVK